MSQTKFQCAAGDYEGRRVDGAIHHCNITGHTLSRTNADGTTMTISLEEDEDAGLDDLLRQA